MYTTIIIMIMGPNKLLPSLSKNLQLSLNRIVELMEENLNQLLENNFICFYICFY
jgi:hypothetical protein